MDSPITPFAALQQAATILGSTAALARICGVSQPSAWRWFNQKKPLPAEYVLRVEAASGVSRHHLRPDVYPSTCARQKPVPQPARFLGVDLHAQGGAAG